MSLSVYYELFARSCIAPRLLEFTEKRLIPFTKVSLLFRQFYFSIWKHVIYYDNTFTYARSSASRIVGKRMKRDDRWR